MFMPLFPSYSTEIVLNEPGHFIGYFEACCPNAPSFPYAEPINWVVVSCKTLPGVGSHGGCSNCIMSLIELIYTGPNIDPPIEEPLIIEPMPTKNIWWYLLILILLLLMIGDK